VDPGVVEAAVAMGADPLGR